MARYALLLRGVNVGTKNTLKMADLRAMLDEIGCTDVTTVLQSGNAVFDTKLKAPALTRAIEERLAEAMGRPIATTLRTRAQMSAIVRACPFQREAKKHPAYVCVTFLSTPPTPEAFMSLIDGDFGDELYQISGTEIFTWHPRGQSKGTLATAIAKLKLEGTITVRNWNTVQKLEALLEAD